MNMDTPYLVLRVAIILAIYAFLIFALYTLWKDLSRSTEPQLILPEAYLDPIRDSHDLTAFRLEIVNLVGRSSSNRIQLDDPTVSASHARLSFQHGQWWLEDLGSTNGTMVNELELTEPLVVTYSDVIHFGKLGFELVRQLEVQEKTSIPQTENPKAEPE